MSYSRRKRSCSAEVSAWEETLFGLTFKLYIFKVFKILREKKDENGEEIHGFLKY